MALIPLDTQRSPIGRFDLLDTVTINGGEVVFLDKTVIPPGDKAVADVLEDGYSGTTTKYRPVVNLGGTSVGARPFFLADEGTGNAYGNGMGTLFGQIVGGTGGQQVTGGAVLGPNTATGSGKCTLWRDTGFYGVSLDNVSADATYGLQPSNNSCTPGAGVTYNSAGLLVLDGGAASGAPTPLAYFEEFMTNGSLVNTPPDLVAALNSPSGAVASASAKRFTMAVIYWVG